jgi:hypothetical protein
MRDYEGRRRLTGMGVATTKVILAERVVVDGEDQR